MEKLSEIIRRHDAWLKGSSGGVRADLSQEDLSHADFRFVNLSFADLSGANLIHGNLSHADLSHADLSHTNLCHANLRRANLFSANLCFANLSHANLLYARLCYAKIAHVRWSAPSSVLLANWGKCSDALTIELMRYDAYNHEDPYSFDLWKTNGTCPYEDVKYQRSAFFKESRELWPGWNPRKKVKSAYELMQLVLAEKCIGDNK